MKFEYDKIAFLVGIGAPVDLYKELLRELQAQLPIAIEVLVWWDLEDCGKKDLDAILADSKVMIIAHSAGGMIALESLVRHPDAVKRIVMLDSHVKQGVNSFPKLEEFLEILIRDDNESIKTLIRTAYIPTLQDSANFYKSLDVVLQWNNDHLEDAFEIVASMPKHSILYIGFSDANYKIYDNATEEKARKFWQRCNIDVNFMPMNHFDFVVPQIAKNLGGVILKWCNIDYKLA